MIAFPSGPPARGGTASFLESDYPEMVGFRVEIVTCTSSSGYTLEVSSEPPKSRQQQRMIHLAEQRGKARQYGPKPRKRR